MTPQSPPRRWERQTVDLPVKVAIYNDSEVVLVPGRVTELSEGGMSLYAGMLLKPGDLLDVEFELPFPRTIQAVVRNRAGYSFGLEFVETLGDREFVPTPKPGLGQVSPSRQLRTES